MCGLLQVRKERLGDRITALHQIVSPFGKVSKNIKKNTKTAQHAWIGYIQSLRSLFGSNPVF
jgi:hypothetical protein